MSTENAIANLKSKLKNLKTFLKHKNSFIKQFRVLLHVRGGLNLEWQKKESLEREIVKTTALLAEKNELLRVEKQRTREKEREEKQRIKEENKQKRHLEKIEKSAKRQKIN